MTVKAIIDVPVNTSQFERFQTLYSQYQEQLKETPGIWADVAKEHEQLAKGFKSVTAALLAQNQFAREMEGTQDKQEKHLSASDRIWTSIGKTTKGVAGNIFEATKALAKWTGLLSAVGGLLGAGGLFGIDRMAASAAGKRRSAMGLGLSSGEHSAFQIDLQRLLDPDSFLQNVNEMETDISKQGPAFALMGHGLSGNTGKDSLDFLRAERELAKRTPLGLLGPTFQAFGLNESAESQRRLHSMSESEFKDILTQLEKDSKNLNIPDDALKSWQDFTTQMQRAGGTIYKTFVVGLQPLAGPLEHLSQAFTHFVEVLGNSDDVRHAIDTLAHWLDSFSGKLSAPEFLAKIERFTSDVGGLADAIHAIAHPVETVEKHATGIASKVIDFVGANNPITLPLKIAKDAATLYHQWSSKLPPGLLDTVKKLENSGAHAVSPKGAMGVYQFMPDTFKQYADPGADPFNEQDSQTAAERFLGHLEDRFSGDNAKVLAAYNYGEGNVSKLLKAHPEDWQAYLPRETQNYLARGVPMMGGRQNIKVQVNVTAPPGFNAVATASQLAVQ